MSVLIDLSLSLSFPGSRHSRMRSKRLRTTEEPVDLDGGSTLSGSKRKGPGGSPEPKLRKSGPGPTACKEEEKDKEKKRDAEPKQQSQNPNPLQLPGKRRSEDSPRYWRL